MKKLCLSLDEDELLEFSEALKALAHPVRLRIVAGLLENECHVKIIQANLGLPQSTVSQHLSVLRKQKILRAERRGNEVCYRVVDPRAAEIIRLIKDKHPRKRR